MRYFLCDEYTLRELRESGWNAGASKNYEPRSAHIAALKAGDAVMAKAMQFEITEDVVARLKASDISPA